MTRLMDGLQSLGRALMLPIAVLPIAGLLLRLGQPDLLDVTFLASAGDAIFSNLGLLFAIGVATGFARDGDGAACLAGTVCFLVARAGAQALILVPADVVAGMGTAAADLARAAWKAKAIAKLEVPIGILSGLAGGLLYNRFSRTKMPDYLAFFGGRRFVPIVSGLAGVGMGGLVGGCYGSLSAAIDHLSWGLAAAGPWGLFAFGVLNRLLLVTGLHHILNNIFWFVLGEYAGSTGDLRRFFAGDPQAGAFMTGFFPVMMFGLPAACLAMYHAALPDRRKAVAGMLFSLAMTSLLTGVTEPIEFTFMFLAPALFLLHALLTGLSMAATYALGMRLGFGFSAGLLDYLLNFGRATRPLLLLPVGAIYALVYYSSFRFCIRRFDLTTPGREDQPVGEEVAERGTDDRGVAFVRALGGAGNLASIGACTTRLRLVVNDPSIIDDRRLAALGAHGVLRPSPGVVQVVVGAIADQVSMEMRAAAGSSAAASEPCATSPEGLQDRLPTAFQTGLGGARNVVSSRRRQGRYVVKLVEPDLVDEDALRRAGLFMMEWIGRDLHLLCAATGQ